MDRADGRGQSRLRRALHRFAAPEQEVQDRELQADVARLGCTSVGSCGDRQSVTVTGSIRSVLTRCVSGSPRLEAELYDGTGSVSLVFLGRKRIPGIEAGRQLVARGRMTQADPDALRVMYNPDYELVGTPVGAESDSG